LRRNSAALIAAALVVFAAWLRLWHLAWMPGIDGDEGWWGVQALRWLHGQPYEAHTTNGNPVDVFLLVPLGLAHAVWAPSFTLLRAVPAVLNLVALPIGFLLVRRLYGSTTAGIQTVATAVLPTAIAHSRLCQDPSQSIPWTVIVAGLSLLSVKERSRAWLYGIAACVTFVVAVRTHPTNVFVAPFVALSVAAAVGAGLPPTRRGRAVAIVILLVAVAIPLRLVMPQVQGFVRSNELLNKPWLAIAAGHLARPSSWFEFLVNYGRLFDGVVVYHYLSDPQAVSVASDLGFAIAAPAIVCGFGLALRGERSAVDAALAIAWLSSAFLFFAFAGPEALRPNFERWGLCLIAPGTLVIARGISGWIHAAPRWRGWTIGASCALAFGLLGTFYLHFVRVFETSGGRAHVTFVSANPEPKQQAFDLMLSRRSHDEPVLIVGQLWWQFYPIDYLAQAHPDVLVAMRIPPDDAPELRDALARGRVFFVEFANTPELTRAGNWIRARGRRMTDTTIRDQGGRDLLHVLEAR
jgi:hypothetical protein